MSRDADFRSAFTSLWLRLITLAIVGLVFAEALYLAHGTAERWTFYLRTNEVAFEVLVRLIVAALTGIAMGSICAAVIGPFLLYFRSSRGRIIDWATQVAVVLVLFADSRFALTVLIASWMPNRGPRFTTALLTAHFLTFVVALSIPRARKKVVTSLDGFLSEKMTRRTALATVVGTAALVATEYALGKSIPRLKAALASPSPKSNFLLITFDALCAEDMSLYGCQLPTTPNIDAFARKGTMFTNFYSASTFTTSSVATLLTGLYPSECRVFHTAGQLHAKNSGKSLPHLMRAAGYATGAFISNPLAYFLAKGLENEFDVLPEPVFRQGALRYLWNTTTPLHQDSGFGGRLEEFLDLERAWYCLGHLPVDLSGRLRPSVSFEQARRVLAKLPDGYFLWVHVITPHDPYLPDSADRGRFLPDAELRTFEEEYGNNWKPHYGSDQQYQVNRRRLAYDEFIATADRAFGAFVSELENSGKLQNTTVIVSADHGESFEGGVYQHFSPYQTRPVIHVPLVIRTPGQQDRRTVAVTADQTALVPTILELAGVAKPDWMRGQSLVPWLERDGQGAGEGLAFSQYLATNSLFKPLRHGTVGVIDGQSQHQYVLNMETQKGSLKPLHEAQIWNLDRSAENPALAEQLRAEIHSRFPELVQKPT